MKLHSFHLSLCYLLVFLSFLPIAPFTSSSTHPQFYFFIFSHYFSQVYSLVDNPTSFHLCHTVMSGHYVKRAQKQSSKAAQRNHKQSRKLSVGSHL